MDLPVRMRNEFWSATERFDVKGATEIHRLRPPGATGQRAALAADRAMRDRHDMVVPRVVLL